MRRTRHRRCWTASAAPVVVVLLASPLSQALDGPAELPGAVVNITELLVAAVAALAFGWRARRNAQAGVEVRGPLVFGLACLAWCGGQAAWTVYEVVLHRPSPTPSVADIGFLGFYLLAPLGMVLTTGSRLQGGSRLRTAIDGLVIAGALLVVSWSVVLSPLVRSAQDQLLLLVLHIAYPVADVFVVSAAVVVMSRTRLDLRLSLLSAGAALLALSDSSFIFLSIEGRFATGGLPDAGWTSGFVLLTAAALVGESRDASRPGSFAQRLPFALPYIPVLLAGGEVVIQVWRGAADAFALTLMSLVGAAVMGRQALLVRENTHLMHQLDHRGRELHRMAYTDPLTGIANRLAFTERLELVAAGTHGTVASFCDLDFFKAVNDHCGHATGDALLVAVAARLVDAVRPQDLVARLGGDEFAVLVDSGGDDGQAAGALLERMTAALTPPYSHDPALVALGLDADAQRIVDAVTASVGVVSGSEVGGDAKQVLQVADQRMYAAKRGRSGVRQRLPAPAHR